MRNSLAIAAAFVRMFFRDRSNVFFTLVFNVLLLVLLGTTVEDRFNVRIPVAIADDARTPAAAAVIERLRGEPNLRVALAPSPAGVRAAVRDGQAAVGILLARGGGDTLAARLLTDPSRAMWARLLRPALLAAIAAPDARGVVTEEPLRARHLRYFDFLFPGLLAFTIMQIGFAGGLSLLQHRKTEALQRLKLTPLTRVEFLGGFAMSQGLILGVQLALYWAVAVIGFGYHSSGVPATIALVTAVGAAEFVCVGLVLGAMAPSIEAGSHLVRFLTFPAAFLCGVFVPLDTLPRHLAQVAGWYPLTPFAQALRAAANQSATLPALATPLALMAAALVIAAALATWAFRWEEQAA